MKTTLKIQDGGRLVVQPMPFGKSVLVAYHDAAAGRLHQIQIPVDMAGVFAQAVEVAAAAAAERPTVNHGVSVLKLPALCGQVSNGIVCDTLRVGIEKLCPDCNPWRPGVPA